MAADVEGDRLESAFFSLAGASMPSMKMQEINTRQAAGLWYF